MSLATKSTENLSIAEYCLMTLRQYHIAAARAYYAAYQKGKEYLASFNPSEGNRHINHSDLFKQTQVAMRRNHGTLPWPEVEFDVNKLSKYGDIHHIRKLADYQEDVIDESQAQECINFAKEVNNILKKYWHKR
jgi:uncharacterized protein (UPF0332 family)